MLPDNIIETLDATTDDFRSFRDLLQQMRDRAKEKYDSLSIPLQDSDWGMEQEDYIDNLDDAVDSIEDLISDMDDVMDYFEDIQDEELEIKLNREGLDD